MSARPAPTYDKLLQGHEHLLHIYVLSNCTHPSQYFQVPPPPLLQVPGAGTQLSPLWSCRSNKRRGVGSLPSLSSVRMLSATECKARGMAWGYFLQELSLQNKEELAGERGGKKCFKWGESLGQSLEL